MQARGGRRAALRTGAVLASVVASLLVFAPPAMADERFAEVGGDGPFPCTNLDRCSIETAVSTALSGDTIYPSTGTYDVSTTLELPVGVNLAGIAGDVTISSTASTALRVVAASSTTLIRNLTINHAPSSGSSTAGLELLAGAGMLLTVTSNGDSACVLTGAITTAVLTNSICRNASSSPRTAVNSFSAVDSTAKIYGVTAISDNGAALFVSATADGADVNLIGGNVIAQGAYADQAGFNSSTTSTSSAINLSNSNFDTLNFTAGNNATGTDSNVNNNQSALPLLDPSFHQLPGSPTINAGGSFIEQSFLDIDEQERPMGAAIDIGADEAEGEPPNTLITGKPPKRTAKRVAKFKFSSTEAKSTFECKIDSKPFKPCTSPVTYRNLKPGKRHTFQVRATDAFLNTDETPAKYSWKVRR